jgi:hypothetical protein
MPQIRVLVWRLNAGLALISAVLAKALDFEKLVDLGIGKAGVGSEINERDLAAIARHRRCSPVRRASGSRSNPYRARYLSADDNHGRYRSKIGERRKVRNGDMTAAKIILDRIAPVRRSNSFDLPRIERRADRRARAAILDAVANGDLTPGEAADIFNLIDRIARAFA